MLQRNIAIDIIARRHIIWPGAPEAFRGPQCEFEHIAVQKEFVGQVILGVSEPVQRRVLDIEIGVGGIEVDVADGRCVAGLSVGDVDFREEGWGDEVEVLAGVGEDAHHGEGDEGAHGTGIVVAGYADQSGVELGWDVGMDSVRGPSWSAGVVVLVDCQESLLVADVQQAGFMEIVKSTDKLLIATKECDQRGHVLRDEECVKPGGTFIGFMPIGV